MGVIDEVYLPARQETDDQELESWVDDQLKMSLTLTEGTPTAPGAGGAGPPSPLAYEEGVTRKSLEAPPAPAPAPPAPAPPAAPPPPAVPPGHGATGSRLPELSQERTPGQTIEPPSPSQPSWLLRLGHDVTTGVTEIPFAVFGGARDALVNTADMIIRYSAPSVPGVSEPALGSGLIPAIVPEVAQPESTTGQIVRSAAQFLAVFLPVAGVTAPLRALSPIAQAAAAGAVADMSAFDPQSPRLSNLINDLAPQLKNPLTDYLAAQEDDTDAEGRMKNALEGIVPGVLLDTFIKVAKAIKHTGGRELLRQAVEPLRGEAGAVRMPGPGAPDALAIYDRVGHWLQQAEAEARATGTTAGHEPLRRVSERIRRGEVPDDILRDMREVFADTIDRETGERFRWGDPEYPRTGTLLDFADDWHARQADAAGVEDIRTLTIEESARELQQYAPARPTPQVAEVPVSELHLDPQRFQYKVQSGAGGSTGSLAGVQTYDPNLAGIIQVWVDPADGKTYVVNGHNRVDLARRLGAETVTVRYLAYATAEEARTMGALTNVAEGRGTAIDAAKLFRDTGMTRADVEARGIPLREKIATDGLALANLADPLFQQVVQGTLPLERAIIIGSRITDHDQQLKLVQLLEGKRVNVDMVRELADFVRDAPNTQIVQETLFGAEETTVSLALDKARLAAGVRERLATDKSLFAKVSKTSAAERLTEAGNIINIAESERIAQESAQLLEIFDRLKNSTGLISDILNDAAAELSAGGNIRDIQQRTYQRLSEALPEAIRGAEAADAGRLSAGISAGQPTTSTGDVLSADAERTRGAVSAAGVPIREPRVDVTPEASIFDQPPGRPPTAPPPPAAGMDLTAQAVAHFGLTADPTQAGWMLADGRLLNRMREGRRTDHSEIGVLFGKTGPLGQTRDPESLYRFMGETGAIRLNISGAQAEFVQADIPGTLTPAQQAHLLRLAAAAREVTLDVSDPATQTMVASHRWQMPTERQDMRQTLAQYASGSTPPGAPPRPPLPPGEGGGPPPGEPPRDVFAEAWQSPGRFNPMRQAASAKLRTLTAEINVLARDLGVMAEQTRGTVSQQETVAAARELIRTGQMSLQRILTFEPGTILNAEEATAARFIRDATGKRHDQLMVDAAMGDATARAHVITSSYLASFVEAATEAATGTEPARTLAARRILSRAGGVSRREFQDLLTLLRQGQLTDAATAEVQKAIADVVTTTADVPTLGDAVKTAAAQELPPGQVLAGLWDILLRGALTGEAEGLDPTLLSQVLQTVQDRITKAVPEGALLGGLTDVMGEGLVRVSDPLSAYKAPEAQQPGPFLVDRKLQRVKDPATRQQVAQHGRRQTILDQIARDEQEIDPNVMLALWHQLAGAHEKQAFLDYYANTSIPRRLINAFLEARSAGLLSHKSLLRNLVGNTATTVWAVPERVAIGVYSQTLGSGKVYPSEAVALLHGYWVSQKEALRMAGRALKTGESQVFAEFTKHESRSMLPAISGDALGLTGIAGRSVDVYGEIARWTFRGLVAGDDYFKWVNYTAERHALAYRDYRQRLATGATQDQAQAAYVKALADPPAWLDEAAQGYSLYQTFNDEIINPAGQKFLELRNTEDSAAADIARFVVPFARTPMNVMGYGAERTPGLNYLSSHYHQEIAAGGARKDAARGRLALGTTAFLVLAGYAMNGGITGRGPKDPKLRQQYLDNGWKPYSFVLPGGVHDPFRGFEPLSGLLGQAADFAELVNRGAGWNDLATLATSLVLSSTEYMEEQPMLKGISDIIDAIEDTETRAPDVLRQLLASSFPLPGFQNLARLGVELLDPELRETRGPHGDTRSVVDILRGDLPTANALPREVEALWQEIASRTPNQSNNLYSQRDGLYGEPLLRQGGIWAFLPSSPSAQQPDPARTELNRLGVAIPQLPKSLGGGKIATSPLDPTGPDVEPVELSGKEWDHWQERSGTITVEPDPRRPLSSRLLTLREYLNAYIETQEYQEKSDGPDGGKALEIRRVVRLYRDAAREELFGEEGTYPRVYEALQEKAAAKEYRRMDIPEQRRSLPPAGLSQSLGR